MKTNKWTKFLTNNTVVPILIIILIVAAILDRRFMTPGNLLNVFNQNSIKGIMAIGMTFVIINGYFDMSLCTLVSLTAGLSCGLQEQIGLAGAITVALLVGLLVGVINGFMIAYAGINAFVVTLSLMLGCRGLTYIYSNEQSILSPSMAFVDFGMGKFLGLTYTSWLFIVGLVIAFFVLKYTMHGRNTYAAGGNASAAENAGIKVKKTIFINFVICGVLSGLAGFSTRRERSFHTGSGMPDMHMLVIAGVVLGGNKTVRRRGNHLVQSCRSYGSRNYRQHYEP